ncbi:D-glucuronyl C5-epimerase family protein [Micromonospora eburnea]|uniref:D-glucuronyl C5-epimerase C-terminus n=1 Tax=Micromonospora eburnea TaxID=227316 RepID=A0A1C6V2R0_9ACTN|nr:D-glucuronyl C5-epimerase family protein [Micromonospora eburnea]SCL60623.1 D-glucuronyl C5-epimerase C-terminus [Micromonospora eburnea]
MTHGRTTHSSGRSSVWSRRALLGTGLAVGALPLLGGDVHTLAATAALPFQFRYRDLEIRELPVELRPYALTAPLPLGDTGTHDAQGVRMVFTGGRQHEHPVGQAQYGLALLESHRLTGTAEYLNRAIKQAQRLVDRRVLREDAWFYPYEYNYRVHAAYQVHKAPWYSMMSQGQALSLFSRLHQVTNDPAWRAAADATFASFRLPPVARKPWGVHVEDGLLWLDEYPNPRTLQGDRTYNGHTFSAYGLWDYWVLTRNPYAKLLLQGALTTTRDAYSMIRNPGARSKYCLHHAKDSNKYHFTHSVQHLQLHAITGDEQFARIADVFYSDFPPHGVHGEVRLTAGTHTGYRFSSTGELLDSRTLTLARAGSAPFAERQKIPNQSGFWYLISGGSLSGYHVAETRGVRYVVGVKAAMTYLVPRTATVVSPSLTAYETGPDGAMTSVVAGHGAGERVSYDRRAVVNGVEHLRLASGPYAGRWVGLAALRAG